MLACLNDCGRHYTQYSTLHDMRVPTVESLYPGYPNKESEELMGSIGGGEYRHLVFLDTILVDYVGNPAWSTVPCSGW